MGFVHDVKKVIAKLPKQRQNLMFSATMPKEIEQLAAGILQDPAFVKVDPVSSTVDRIDQSLYFVEKGNKKFLLPWLIKNLNPPVVNALVFSRTKHGADKIAKDLNKQGIPAAAIHGNKSQSARVAALEGFKAGKTSVLVATDIAARGIDISELSPRLQLRPARGARDLCPPHRAHGPRRCRRHGGELLRTRGKRVSGRHRKAEPPSDPGHLRPPLGRRARPGKSSAPGAGQKTQDGGRSRGPGPG